MNQYDHFKNKFRDYKVDIDKDKLWKNTSHAIPKKKRRPVALIVLLAGLFLSGWLLHSDSFLPSADPKTAIVSSQQKNPPPIGHQSNTTLVGNQDATPLSSANAIEVLSSEWSGSLSKFISSKNGTPPVYIPKSNTKGDKILIKKPHDHNGGNESIYIASNANQNENIVSFKNEAEIGNILNQNGLAIENKDEVIKAELFGLHRKSEKDQSTHAATHGPIDFLSKSVSPISVASNAGIVPDAEANTRPLKTKFLESIQLVQGIGLSKMKINALKTEATAFATELQQKMHSLEILSTSASATLHFPFGFSMEPGLQWSRLTTVIDHDWDTSERLPQEGVTTIIIDENGIPQSITGSTIITRTYHHHAKRFTEHQDIDILVRLHKTIWKTHRFSIDAFVKGSYNLSFQSRGSYLSKNGEIIGFAKEDNPFALRSPFSIGGGLQLKYHLRPHLNLIGGLALDQQSYHYKDPAVPVHFQHSGFSGRLGMGYVF